MSLSHDLPGDIQRRVDRYAKQSGVDPNSLVIRFIEQELSRLETEQRPALTDQSLFGRLQGRGLIGALAGGPADLSSHPRHMEGFGELADRPNPH